MNPLTLRRLIFTFVALTTLVCMPALAFTPSASYSPADSSGYSSSLLAPPPLPHSVNARAAQPAVQPFVGPYFDLPVTYNSRVKTWIKYYQGSGRHVFKIWLERSYRYMPKITSVLAARRLPRDLAYLAMIESGFSQLAVSQANAVGPWQFMKSTAQRYGLHVNWWIDERRDTVKSTIAAATYLNHLHRMFHSWYLAAAAYNMGENRVRNLIGRYHTDNYWILSKKRDFPVETEQYIPKLIAAMLIAKAPGLYGFRELTPMPPLRYDEFFAPGGTDLQRLAYYLGLPRNSITRLNPEIIKGFIPFSLRGFEIRIPKGELAKARRFIHSHLVMSD